MKSKKLVIALLIIAVLTLLINKSFAAGSFSANLTPSSSRVSKGSEVTVTLKVSGISLQDGMGILGLTLKYDSDVLSIEKESDVVGKNDWTATATNIDNVGSANIVFERVEAISTDHEVATIKFLVKESTTATATTIQAVSVTGTDGTANAEETTISDISTNISIGAPTINSSPSTTPSSTPSNTPANTPSTQSPSATTTVTPNNEKANGTTTVKDENYADTGAETYIIPLILGIAILGIVSFVNYRRIKIK